MIHALSGNRAVPGVVVGIGSDVPSHTDARGRAASSRLDGRVRHLRRPHRREQGLQGALRVLRTLRERDARDLTLVLVGTSILPIPEHPRLPAPRVPRRPRQVRPCLGCRGVGHAVVLREPVDGGARSLGSGPAGARQRAVRRAARTVRPQQRRALLRIFEEFAETLNAIEAHPQFAHALGQNGRDYYRRHYAWPVIEQKYLDMLDQLAEADRAGQAPPGIEALPGMVRARRRRTCRPAAEVLAEVPGGPVLPARRPDRPRPQRRPA